MTRAISGHATEQMQQHYSTVAQTEMRQGIAKIISLAGVRWENRIDGEESWVVMLDGVTGVYYTTARCRSTPPVAMILAVSQTSSRIRKLTSAGAIRFNRLTTPKGSPWGIA